MIFVGLFRRVSRELRCSTRGVRAGLVTDLGQKAGMEIDQIDTTNDQYVTLRCNKG